MGMLVALHNKKELVAVVAAAEQKISQLFQGVAELRNLLAETQRRIQDEQRHKHRANLERKRGEIEKALAHDEAQLQALLKDRPRVAGRTFDTGSTGLHARAACARLPRGVWEFYWSCMYSE